VGDGLLDEAREIVLAPALFGEALPELAIDVR